MSINLKYPTFAVLIGFTILTIILVFGMEKAEAERDGLQSDVERLEDRPIPTVTVRVTSPPRTVKVTLPPKVITKTVEVERTSQRASRSGSRVGDSATLACIRYHESRNNYRAVSRTGKFRGAYQFHQGYAPTWAKRAGYAEWANMPSDRWPPSVQDAVAYDMGHSNGYAAWDDHTSYNCPGFR